MLPKLQYRENSQREIQTNFGGLIHKDGARDGEFYDMENMSGYKFPVASSRPKRYTLPKLAKPNGIFAHDGLFTVDGTDLKLNGENIGTVSDSEKVFSSLGHRVIIFPDKVLYNMDTKKLEPLEESYSATGMKFGDGEYAGVAAKLNTITTTGAPFPFKAGDAVTISEASVKEHNKTPIIREISEDKKTLRFYENTFKKAVTESGSVTLKRSVPDMDFICSNDNRLWGCKADTIYACKLGDPTNWNVFDGLASDSWSVDVGSSGDFTACFSYKGFPIFFKEDHVYKVYGEKPNTYQAMGSATLGVLAGSSKSLAIAGETLYYLSRAGVVAYNGGMPVPVSEDLGVIPFIKSVAGSDGGRYYCSMDRKDGTHAVFVYDQRLSMWFKEDGLEVLQTAFDGGLLSLSKTGDLFYLGSALFTTSGAQEEPNFHSMVETGEYTWMNPAKKYPMQLMARIKAEPGVTIKASIKYDSGPEWEPCKDMTSEVMQTFEFPVPIRRCDHYKLRFEADGPWELYCLAQIFYRGSER